MRGRGQHCYFFNQTGCCCCSFPKKKKCLNVNAQDLAMAAAAHLHVLTSNNEDTTKVVQLCFRGVFSDDGWDLIQASCSACSKAVPQMIPNLANLISIPLMLASKF